MDKDVKLRWKMPEKPECFFGREEELQKMEQFFRKGNNTIFIQGIGGIGKTALAIQYAFMHRVEYDVIVFATCVQDVKRMIVNDAEIPVDNLCRNTFDEYYLETEDEYFQRKFAVLKRILNEKVLLVVDNYQQQSDPDLDEFLEFNCHKIITSRMDFGAKGYPVLRLEDIKEIEALDKIFTHYYYPEDEEEHRVVLELIRLVGGHTLAMEWIAKQLTEQTMTAKEMLTNFQNKSFRIDVSNQENVFSMLSNVFRVNELGEREKDVLRFLCFVPYTGISKEELVRRGTKGTHTAVLRLLRSSWLKQVELDVVTLHPVVIETVVSELQITWDNTKDYLGTVVRDLQDRDYPAKDLEHLLFIAQKAMSVLGADEPGAVDMLCAVGEAFFMRYKQVDMAMKYFQRAFYLQGEKLEQVKAKVALCKQKDILDAEYAQIKEIALENNKKYYWILHRIGDLYFQIKKYEKALECYMKLSECSTEDVYCDIANVYMKAGELRKAIEYVEAGIKMKQSKYGEDEVPLVNNCLLLAKIYGMDRDWHLVDQYLEEALRIAEEQMTQGQKSDFYYSYAMVLKEMKMTDRALEFDQKAYVLRRKMYGEEHLRVVRSYAAMALDYYCLGDYESALECSLREIRIRKKLRRVKRRLYMSVSRLVGFIDMDTLSDEMKEELKVFTSDFNRLLKDNPVEAMEMMQQ